MNTNTSNWPATVRELGDLAEQRGMTATELLEEMAEQLGPMPMPPAGFTLAKGCADLWIGTDAIHPQYMITPAWNAATDRRTVELWTAKGTKDEVYTSLTPLEAIQLAADLIKLAQDALRDGAE